MVSRRPPSRVLAAFGAAGNPVPLEGGQGSSWLVDDLVVKPLDLSEEELAWQADVLGPIRCDGFRVARPRLARDGHAAVAGWCAWERVDGSHEKRRWAEIIASGERFHAALAGLPRPSFLDRRANPWAIGDRAAWGDLPIEDFSHVKHIPRLASFLRPVEAPSQLIHGDLTGNVLFAEGLEPAIIDFSPYWRPTGFASAIVVADALVWEDADETLLSSSEPIEQFDQLLIRALIYRSVTDRLFRQDDPVRPDADDPFLPAVEFACELAKN